MTHSAENDARRAEVAREHRAARGWAEPSDVLRLPALDEAVRRATCPTCDGRGEWMDEPCTDCNGDES